MGLFIVEGYGGGGVGRVGRVSEMENDLPKWLKTLHIDREDMQRKEQEGDTQKTNSSLGTPSHMATPQLYISRLNF